jgi:hypothetical protein
MSKLRFNESKDKKEEFLALTSLTVEEFLALTPAFEQSFQAHMAVWRLDGKARTKRCYTTYRNCPLPTAEERLLFVLSYVKGNPLQSNHGTMFGLRQGKTNNWLQVLLPVLRETLRTLGVAPSRSLQSLADQLGLPVADADAVVLEPEAALPLFAMMPRNGASNALRMKLNRPLATAARKKAIP